MGTADQYCGHTEKHEKVGKVRHRDSIIGFGAILRIPIVKKPKTSGAKDLQARWQLLHVRITGNCLWGHE
jgi:hypothetical protein